MRIAIGLFLTLLMYPTFGFSETPGVTSTEIKLGNHSPQSGDFAVYGTSARVAKAYFDMVNEKGGVNGRKINFIVGDSRGNPQQALQVTKQQVEDDKVLAMVANNGAFHMAVYKYLRDRQVPDLWSSTVEDVLTNPVFPTTFRFASSFATEAKFYAELVAKKWPGKTIGVIYPATQGGKEAVEAFKTALNGRAQVVAEENDPRVDANAKSQVLNLKKAGAEVIYGLVYIPTLPAAMKFAHEQGYHPQWLLNYTASFKLLADLAGKEATEGAIGWFYVYTDADGEVPGVKKFVSFMKERMPNEKINALAAAGYALGETTVETLKRAGKDPTRESVLKAAESFKDWKCSICRAPNSTGPEKHDFNTPKQLLQVKNGNFVPYKDKK